MLALTWMLTLAATDVTSDSERAHNLIEYVEGREDLSTRERAELVRVVKRTFGGKALTDGFDEGITAAKSVISGAVFFGVPFEAAVKGAYAAYHDVARWVPPPVAINYQLLTFRGRRPRFSAREMAYDFPSHFDPEIAPELARWWDRMLRAGKIPRLEEKSVREALAATRRMMRPFLLERLWLIVAREAAGASENEIRALLAQLEDEFARVGGKNAHRGGVYARYRALARELGKPVKPRPARATPRAQAPVEPGSPNTPAEPPQAATPGAPTAPRKGPLTPWAGLIRAPGAFVESLSSTVTLWIGTPYLFGGTTRRGVDCSAFSRAVIRRTLAVDIPRNARGQAGIGRRIKRGGLRPGDLVFFDTLERGHITHVGIYLGDGVFAHASSSRGVVRDQLSKRYYTRAYRTSRRLVR